MIKDGEVVIVDEFTGRLMPGRRWSDGLHQAVEAKEKVKIERENQTLATVTFQNYFRKYKKLAGMTGTADTEAEEFNKIYKLDVVVIPANRPLRRLENPDLVYRTEKEKWDAIVTEIVDEHAKGRPVLVGTVSIEKSEKLSTMLDRRGLKRGTTTGGGADKHVVLNAKYHAQEAEFVAQAGRKGSVTIATNMAGRGTDILLGGNAEFMARQQCLAEQIAERLPKGEERFVEDEQFAYFYHLDAFYRVPKAAYQRIFEHFKAQCDAEHDEVIALGGPPHRRDRAARGAAHRQPAARPRRPSGRPGRVPLLPLARRRPDAHLRLGPHFRPDAEAGHGRRRPDRARHGLARDRAGAEAGRSAELLRPQAPARVRRRDEQAAREHLRAAPADSRGQDSVPGRGRPGDDGRHARLPDGSRRGDPRLAGRNLRRPPGRLRAVGPRRAQARSDPRVRRSTPATLDFTDRTSDEIRDALWETILQSYDEKEQLVGREVLERVERDIMLQIVDSQWKDHLYSLDHLKEGIGLRGYGQRDPLIEYKKESFELFQAMKDRVDEEIVRYLWWLRPVMNDEGGRAGAAASGAAPRAADSQRPVGRIEIAPEQRAARAAGRAGQPVRPVARQAAARVGGDDAAVKTVRRDEPKVGRNDPCPCGSGKKYKKCHGTAA